MTTIRKPERQYIFKQRTPETYVVLKLYNATSHVIGEVVQKDEVERLIGLGYKVTVQ